MKNRITAVVLSLILVFSLSACSLSPGAPVHSDEILPTAANEAVNTPSHSATPTATPSATPTAALTAPPTLMNSPSPAAPDDITAQDLCIMSYFEALKENDADKIIQVSSSSIVAEAYRNMTDSDLIGELFSISQTFALIKNTSQFIYSILSDFSPSQHDRDYAEKDIGKFIRDVDPARLKDIKVICLGTPVEQPKIDVPEGVSVDMNMYFYRCCLFSINKKMYYQLFWLLKSASGYKITLIGDQKESYPGVAKPMTQDNFYNLIDPKTLVNQFDDLPISSSFGETTYLHRIKTTSLPSFSLASEAIDFFADAFASHDIYTMLSACDVKEHAANFDLYKMTEYMDMFSPYNFGAMTSKYDFYRDINLALNCSTAAEGIISMLFSLSFDFDLEAQYTTLEFFSAIKNSCDVINSFSVIRNDVFAPKDGLREIFLEQAAALGADDMEHRIIEYKFNGKKFIGALALINYDGSWSIKEFTSPLINLPALLPVAPSDKLDYDSYI